MLAGLVTVLKRFIGYEFGLIVGFLLFLERRSVLYEVIEDRMYEFFTSCMRSSSM